MTIYRIDRAYTGENDEITYYVSPYSLRGVINTYLKKRWVGKNGKNTRNIIGLIRFFRQSSFNRKKLEKKAKKINTDNTNKTTIRLR